jgi:hypothetical protein
MDRSCIVFIIFVAIILLSASYKWVLGDREGFGTYNSNFKRYCDNCSERSNSYDCGDCINCGICTSSTGVNTCKNGDSRGPFDTNNCAFWNYSDVDVYYPETHRFPEVPSGSLYPYSKTFQMRSCKSSEKEV